MTNHHNLDDETRMIVDTVRGFVKDAMLPHEDLVDRLGHVPEEIVPTVVIDELPLLSQAQRPATPQVMPRKPAGGATAWAGRRRHDTREHISEGNDTIGCAGDRFIGAAQRHARPTTPQPRCAGALRCGSQQWCASV